METDSKIRLINDKELMALFDELIPSVQNKIIVNGLKSAASIITKQAKQNFKGTKKNKSKTGYKDLNSSFKIKPMNKELGVIAGMQHREGYKYRFLNYGTEQRSYKTKKGKQHDIGKIVGSNFFTDAVNSKKEEANKNIQDEIVKSMNKTVNKWNKKYKM